MKHQNGYPIATIDTGENAGRIETKTIGAKKRCTLIKEMLHAGEKDVAR